MLGGLGAGIISAADELTGAGASKVTVYWDEVPGATGYRVRWGLQSGSYPNASGVLPGSARRYTVSGLVSEQEYYFVVEAEWNGAGSFFEFVGIGYQPLFGVGELPFTAQVYCPPNYRLWDFGIATNFPTVGGIVSVDERARYYQEVVHINLRR